MNLNDIGLKYGTDKSSNHHDFLKVYEQYFESVRNKNISLIEIGYGGYEFEDRGGESARTWYEYFPNAKFVYVDLYNKIGAMNDRTDFFQGSQTDKHLLKTIIEREAGAEKRVVIDDASHINPLTIETFEIVFPLLKSGDLYFVEDVHTSYWSEHGYEGNECTAASGTTMQFFSFLTHQLNAEHFHAECRNEFANKIEFIHFYKEMIVIKKL